MSLPACKPCFAVISQCKRGLFFDVHANVDLSAETSAMHDAAEVFDPHTERVYQALQVISACCVAFAHGSNDVANSIGPFSAIYAVYTTHAIPGSSATTPEWMFVLGGIAIMLGLLMYGYNIILQLGVNMLKLTPSRGFSVELAAGLTIALASFFGIPVSTTQIIVGAEVRTASDRLDPFEVTSAAVFYSLCHDPVVPCLSCISTSGGIQGCAYFVLAEQCVTMKELSMHSVTALMFSS